MPGVDERVTAAAVVLCFVSLKHEPPTQELREQLRSAGVQVLLPVAGAAGELTWVVDPGDTARAWGVPGQPDRPPHEARLTVPAQPAIVAVPALAVTPEGHRLGQGGGYYDRLLASLPSASAGGPLRVAVVGPGEVLDSIPTDAHDERVDAIAVG